MATSYASNNPLTLTVNDNLLVRAIFRQINENEPTVPTVSEFTWRDCVSGENKTGSPPSGYVEVAYTGAGGGTCWEPRAVIGFEPSLEQALRFDYRRGDTSFPEAKTVTVTNPSASPFEVKITTNSEVVVTPTTFTVNPRSSATMTIKPMPELLQKLGDGVTTLSFKIELTEKI